MTPLQEGYLNKLRATAEANMVFFKENLPTLFRILSNEGVKSSIDISEQGDITVRYENGQIKGLIEDSLVLEDRLKRFADLQDRPQVLAFHKLRNVEENPSYGNMQRYYYSNLDQEYPNRVRKHFAKHYPDNSGLWRYPDFGDNEIPLLIVFGSGLGAHLTRLMTEYQIKHMIVIDVDVEAFRVSTFFHDYVMLSRTAMARETTLTFIVEPEVDKIAMYLMRILNSPNGLPPFFIHGASVFYSVDGDEKFNAVRDTIVDTLWEMFYGLGYFDDELISVKHTFDNLAQGFPVYQKANIVPEGAVAIVVGSGPSLDGLLPILRDYGDRAVVFSCGTALSALEAAGITPDFHLEKERPQVVYEVITKTVTPEFAKKIHFLGMNVVHTDIFKHFGGCGIVTKSADTMGYLLMQKYVNPDVILSAQPTVTNMGVDFALSAGFKKIYLIGVDLGYRDKEKHHSPNTAYLNTMPEDDHLKELLSERPSEDMKVPGNFGGEVSTEKAYNMSRKMMGHHITAYPQVQVFNMNDGAKIDGAIPLPMEQFSCDSSVETKERTLIELKKAFQPLVVDMRELGDTLLQQYDVFTEGFCKIMDEERKARVELVDAFNTLHHYIRAEMNDRLPSALLLRGALTLLMSMTFNAITIIRDEDEAVAKATYDFDNIRDFFIDARNILKNTIEDALQSTEGLKTQ